MKYEKNKLYKIYYRRQAVLPTQVTGAVEEEDEKKIVLITTRGYKTTIFKDTIMEPPKKVDLQ